MHHVFIYEKTTDKLNFTIDEVTKNHAWIFRVIHTDKKGSNFSCLVRRLKSGNCAVQIAQARQEKDTKVEKSIIRNFVLCKPLFKFLNIRYIEWKRSLDGPIKIYDLERGV